MDFALSIPKRAKNLSADLRTSDVDVGGISEEIIRKEKIRKEKILPEAMIRLRRNAAALKVTIRIAITIIRTGLVTSLMASSQVIAGFFAFCVVPGKSS